jgi:hypothetical protein
MGDTPTVILKVCQRGDNAFNVSIPRQTSSNTTSSITVSISTCTHIRYPYPFTKLTFQGDQGQLASWEMLHVQGYLVAASSCTLCTSYSGYLCLGIHQVLYDVETCHPLFAFCPHVETIKGQPTKARRLNQISDIQIFLAKSIILANSFDTLANENHMECIQYRRSRPLQACS